MSYRNFYWKKVKEQLNICWILFWYGVVLDRGHHTEWKNGKRKTRKFN